MIKNYKTVSVLYCPTVKDPPNREREVDENRERSETNGGERDGDLV